MSNRRKIPTGAILGYGGASAPSGWLLCNGAAVSRTTYAGLFTVLASTYGSGDGSTTFNIPDFRTKMPLGKGAAQALGDSGGALTHSHSVPLHSHTFTQPSAHTNHTVTQPAAHSNHVVTQPAAHANHVFTQANAHANHLVTQPSDHANHIFTQPVPHVAAGGHTHDAHTTSTSDFVAGTTFLTGPATHSLDGSHAHDAHAGGGVDAHTAHLGTAVDAHTAHLGAAVDAHSAHSGADVDAHSAHSGADVNAHSAHAGGAVADGAAATSGTGDPPYLVCNFIIKT